MFVDSFDEATLYRGVLDADEAASYGALISRFREQRRPLFFNAPINQAVDVTGVLKAWLSYPEGAKRTPAIADIYQPEENEPETWETAAALILSQLADIIDEITGTPSEVRFLQSYAPEAMLVPHHDRSGSSRVVGLQLPGHFNLHNPRRPNEILHTIEINPGDVLHFMATSLHSATNPSPDAYRETLNLIDM